MGKVLNRTARIVPLLGLAILLGCSGMSSHEAKDPPASLDVGRFTGHWNLDRQSSDDVHARLVPLFEREEQRWRRNTERFADLPPRESDRGGPSDDSTSNFRWVQRERQKEAQALIAFAMPASQLDIHASAHEIRIANDKGQGTRVLTPGESTALFVPIGGFIVTSSWKESGFTIDSKGEGENKIRVIEQYHVSSDGMQLEEHVELHFPAISKQMFRLVYRRG